MTGTIFLIVVLIIAAMLLAATEIVTPTFGVLAVVAVGCVAWAVWLAYSLDPVFGLVFIILVAIGTPVYAVWAARTIPNTRIGQILALRREKATPGEGTPVAGKLAEFVGTEAVATTTLRPAGMVRVADGSRVDAQAESGMIAAGQRVTVIKATGTELIVRAVEDAADAAEA
jgi:membrane-bound ClpP family serine protease